ncbi:ACP S-malonyltransferase [Rapidithrix thailandica]|uniref:[acyl-carrier-protein] S-malonyltransferase n=1 Tax=Rapidithrix thailandica TaxID=413964 RepID=A0AAW9SEZ6_9BACT
MKAYIFPGQGSQKKKMGIDLFDKYPELVFKASDILGYDIAELCIHDPQKQLSQTQFTQPSLYVVNALQFLETKKSGDTPAYLAGHSLGEYNALFAASVYDFETGLRLVKKRAEIMGEIKGGGMAAVIGLNRDRISRILTDFQFDTIDIANYNSSDQIVLSGLREDILKAKKVFEANGAKLYFPLNVSGAFHSRYMKVAKGELANFLEPFDFTPPKIPVISNVTARPYKEANLKQLLTDQLDHEVKWYESISYMIGQGVAEFVETGPGDVLTKMTGYIKQNPMVIPMESEEDLEVKERLNETLKPTIGGNGLGVKSAELKPAQLGCPEFIKDHKVKYAYVAGSMYRGIASKELVISMGKARILSFFGTGGLDLDTIEEAIISIQNALGDDLPFGMNLLHNLYSPEKEMITVEMFLKHNIHQIEASAYMGITPALAYFRIKGLKRAENGEVLIGNKVMAKISRPEVAEAFMSPVPDYIVQKLLQEHKITDEEAALSKQVPVADDVCAEADSAGHTDQGSALTLYPVIVRLRDRLMQTYAYKKKIRVGAAGGIGTPEAMAAAFLLGVDFVLTGSINQCTVQSGISDAAKDLLQKMNVQDTEYVPAGDMFELGAKVQVLKKGMFFPARANKLLELYKQHGGLDELSDKDKNQLQQRYFKRSFDEVFEEVKVYKGGEAETIRKAEQNPKQKMALIFKWYFGYSTQLALKGDTANKVDYQIHCGPALGAFNEWVKGTPLENWRQRNVDEIADKMMGECAHYLDRFYQNKKELVKH